MYNGSIHSLSIVEAVARETRTKYLVTFFSSMLECFQCMFYHFGSSTNNTSMCPRTPFTNGKHDMMWLHSTARKEIENPSKIVVGISPASTWNSSGSIPADADACYLLLLL